MDGKEELFKKTHFLASEIIQKKINLVEGVRALEHLLVTLKIDMDEEFLTIKAVDSESDVFPMGSVRKHWNPEKLKELDKERIEFEKFYENGVFEACRKLVEKFKQ